MSLKNIFGISLKLLNLLLLQQAWTIKDLKIELIRKRKENSSVHCLV